MTFTLRARLFVALCALVLAGVPATAVRADAQADAQAALRRGVVALDRGDARTARIELMNAIKADPRLAAARTAQARALLMLGDGRGASAELEQARALGAPMGSMRHLLAHSALLLGDPETALAQARATDDPGEAPFLARLEAQALQKLGRYDDAARAFDRALQLAPKDPAVRTDIARLRLAAGDMAGALRASDEALELAPNNSDALLLRALMAREQYGPEAARQWFEAALAANPYNVPALVEFAATQADLGRGSEAVALTRRALTIVPGNPRPYYIQAVIAARAGYYDLARSLLMRTRGALDGQAGMRLLRGVLHLQAGNATLAVGELEPLLDGQPLNLRARLLLARAYYEDGQFQDAERTLFPLVERADAGSYALMLAARIQEVLGNRPVADGFLQRAAALSIGPADVYRGAGSPNEVAAAADADPGAAAPNLRYVRALLEAGQGQAAIARARLIVAANPGAPAAHMTLGDSLTAAGRFAEAATVYEQAANMRFDENIALRLVDAWRRAGRSEEARRVLGLFLAQNPMNVEGQRLAASLMLAAGEEGRALELLSGLRERLGNEDALLMADIARAHIGLGHPAAALPYAAHAYHVQPASAVTSDILGWALFSAGSNLDQARELLEKANMLAPAEPLVQFHLGRLYAAAGEKDGARRMLRGAASVEGFAFRTEAEAALKGL